MKLYQRVHNVLVSKIRKRFNGSSHGIGGSMLRIPTKFIFKIKRKLSVVCELMNRTAELQDE